MCHLFTVRASACSRVSGLMRAAADVGFGQALAAAGRLLSLWLDGVLFLAGNPNAAVQFTAPLAVAAAVFAAATWARSTVADARPPRAESPSPTEFGESVPLRAVDGEESDGAGVARAKGGSPDPVPTNCPSQRPRNEAAPRPDGSGEGGTADLPWQEEALLGVMERRVRAHAGASPEQRRAAERAFLLGNLVPQRGRGGAWPGSAGPFAAQGLHDLWSRPRATVLRAVAAAALCVNVALIAASVAARGGVDGDCTSMEPRWRPHACSARQSLVLLATDLAAVATIGAGLVPPDRLR